MNTKNRLLEAAASLLDRGGESAVTLRAVGEAAGVSHNAPYKHFKDRSALLAAVAVADLRMLTASFREVSLAEQEPVGQLQEVLRHFAAYSRECPARYRLLFSDPEIGREGGELEAAALELFTVFASMVEHCQAAGKFPEIPNAALTKLIYASVHGLIDLQAGGRMRKEKGLGSVEEGIALLIGLLERP